MESITKPQVIGKPFCDTGDKNTIPENATGSQLASLEEGFPPITALPVSSGGIPPEREDFNGAMNLNSQFYFAFQNGWWPTFDDDVSSAIGGYALGAVLWWFPVTGSFAGMAVPVKSLTANNTYNFNTNASYIGPYWKPLYKEPSSMAIGTVFFHQSSDATDVPGALPLFTGETISNADQLYPDFYAWVLDHSDLQISAADYATAISTYGECPKYVIDDTNKTIKLPKLVNYLKMANTTDKITQSAAGLPDITCDMYGESGAENNKMANGAGSADKTWSASTFNAIYGNSNTVTPAHTTLYPWVYAYNSAVAASTAQAAQFQSALSSKADTNLSNVTTAVMSTLISNMMPNYTQGVSRQKDTQYTADVNGWVSIHARVPYQGQNTTLVVNGETVVNYNNGYDAVTVVDIIRPIAKGDVWEVGGSNSDISVKFYPCNGGI